MNRKADFLLNESIRINSHNESNRIDTNRELECSTGRPPLSIDIAYPPGPQQQTAARCCRWTDGRIPYRYTDPVVYNNFYFILFIYLHERCQSTMVFVTSISSQLSAFVSVHISLVHQIGGEFNRNVALQSHNSDLRRFCSIFLLSWHPLNKQDAMDRCKWRKVIKDVR